MRPVPIILAVAAAIFTLPGCAAPTGLTEALGLARSDYLAIDLDTGLVVPLTGVPDLTDPSWRTSRILFRAVEAQAGQLLATDAWAAPGEASVLPPSGRYFIAIYEVTQAQWTRMGGQPVWRSISPTADPDGSELPATGVSLDVARSLMTTMSWRILGNLAVPSDDQWEVACRAGATGRFPWGNQPDPAVAAAQATLADTAPGRSGPVRVGLRLPNALGCYDMLGNTAELTMGGNLRGASWADPLPSARPSARRAVEAATAHRLGGLRPVYLPDGG